MDLGMRGGMAKSRPPHRAETGCSEIFLVALPGWDRNDRSDTDRGCRSAFGEAGDPEALIK